MRLVLAILTETKSGKHECSSEVQVPMRFRENLSDAPSTHNEQSVHASENIELMDSERRFFTFDEKLYWQEERCDVGRPTFV